MINVFSKFWCPNWVFQDDKIVGTEPFVGVKDHELNSFELKFDIVLPFHFREMFKISNGGIINVDDEYKNEYSLFVISALSDITTLAQKNLCSQGVLIFAMESNSFWALNYGKNREEPPVVYYDEFTDTLIEVEKSFDDFFAWIADHLEEDE